MHFICWGGAVGRGPPQTPSLSVNAFCIVINSAHETPVYPWGLLMRRVVRITSALIFVLFMRCNPHVTLRYLVLTYAPVKSTRADRRCVRLCHVNKQCCSAADLILQVLQEMNFQSVCLPSLYQPILSATEPYKNDNDSQLKRSKRQIDRLSFTPHIVLVWPLHNVSHGQWRKFCLHRNNLTFIN